MKTLIKELLQDRKIAFLIVLCVVAINAIKPGFGQQSEDWLNA